MSYDALMRWEWEGGNPAFVNDWDTAPSAEPAENDTLNPPRPVGGRRRARRVATAPPPSREDRQGDGRER